MQSDSDLAVPRTSIATDNHGNSALNRPLAIFSDFDGTIFLQDTGHILFDNHGCGAVKREELDTAIGTGDRTFKSASEEMWGSLHVTLDDGCKTLSKHLILDPGFKDFFNYLLKYEIPFNVISAGLKPLLRYVLNSFLGEELSAKIGIVSNDAEISEDGSVWKPIWRHDSELGHDKARSIQEYKDTVEGEQPLLVFIGDGVSDLAAASHADILFARKGLLLEQYCIKNKIPYIPYESFIDIEEELKQLVDGNVHYEKFAGPPTSIELPPRQVNTDTPSMTPATERPPMNSMVSGYIR